RRDRVRCLTRLRDWFDRNQRNRTTEPSKLFGLYARRFVLVCRNGDPYGGSRSLITDLNDNRHITSELDSVRNLDIDLREAGNLAARIARRSDRRRWPADSHIHRQQGLAPSADCTVCPSGISLSHPAQVQRDRLPYLYRVHRGICGAIGIESRGL